MGSFSHCFGVCFKSEFIWVIDKSFFLGLNFFQFFLFLVRYVNRHSGLSSNSRLFLFDFIAFILHYYWFRGPSYNIFGFSFVFAVFGFLRGLVFPFLTYYGLRF